MFRSIEDAARRVFRTYGYSEVGMPLLESTNLFQRTVGENTDIVEKEMYTFNDRNEDSLTLRPEGTAGCVRLAQENGLLFNQTQRLWYSGPMFRYERPQKGRYRQFSQIGAECFGMAGPDVDAEILFLTAKLWRELGITEHLTLELNSLGGSGSRMNFEKALVDYLGKHREGLDEDSIRRLDSNPLRILDSKDPATQALLVDAPKLMEYLDQASIDHFEGLKKALASAEIDYILNPNIVRGLDYYNGTVFEWTTQALGAQGTVCGGGRYDGLVEILGGKRTPAVGFAVGLDRLALLLMETQEIKPLPAADIFVASIGTSARSEALVLGESLREHCPAYCTYVHCGEGKFKAQLKKADASGATIALIIGEDEVVAEEIGIKKLRQTDSQYNIPKSELIRHVSQLMSESEHQ